MTIVDTCKNYRIAAHGKQFKIYKPEGGALSYVKFDDLAAAKREIDRAVKYLAAQENVVFASAGE